MAGEIQSLRERYTEGHGQPREYNSSWVTKFTALATGVASLGTGPTAADLIAGTFPLTGQENPQYNVLHIWVRLRLAADPTKEAPIGSTAKLLLWVRPPGAGAQEFYYVTTLTTSKPGGQLFSLSVLPPGEYRLGLAEITAGAAIDISGNLSQ